jgi:phosphopantetheinyl transferase
LRIDVRYLRAGDLAPLFQDALPLVAPMRRRKALRYLREPDRLRSLGAGLLMARFLGAREDSDILEGPNGGPRLSAGHPDFSVSHSGALVALSVSDSPHGLDLEDLGRPAKFGLLAERILGPGELLSEPGAAGDPMAFFSVWTRKESLMKAMGLGFALDPRSFVVTPLGTESFLILGRPWHFSTWLLSDHVFSLASAYGPFEIQCEELDAQALVSDLIS